MGSIVAERGRYVKTAVLRVFRRVGATAAGSSLSSSGEGLLRRTRNLCLSALIEVVRDQSRIVDLKHVNRVLIQPHWRKDYDDPTPQ